jgi:Trypsin-co-occurring domain 1
VGESIARYTEEGADGNVKFQLEDGSTVYFAAEGNLVSFRGREELAVIDAGKLGDRLEQIAKAAGEVATSMRSTLATDGMQVHLGVKVTGEADPWWFSTNSGERTIAAMLTWKNSPPP